MNMILSPKKSRVTRPKNEQEAKLQPESFIIHWKDKRDLPLWRLMRNTGVMGLVVAIPTGLGMAAGLWVDTLWPNSHSWFSILAPVGFGMGCLWAIFWGYVDQKKSS